MFFKRKPGSVSLSHVSKTAGRKSGQVAQASFKPRVETLENRDLLSVAQLAVIAPSSTMTGVPAMVAVEALNATGQVETDYTGTVQFSSSDAFAGLPSNYTFTSADQGIHVFAIPFQSAGNQTLTATDTATPWLTGTASLSVVKSVDHFQVTITNATTNSNGVTSIAAGSNLDITVTAINGSGVVDTTYQGTVEITSNDSNAVLPGDYTFTLADGGSHTFAVNLLTAGERQVTATDINDPALTGSASVTVTPGALAKLVLTGPSPAVSAIGGASDITVTAEDAYGNPIGGYLGTIHFTSADTAATLPSNYTFAPTDDGTHTFVVILQTVGMQTITAKDTQTSSLTGSIDIRVRQPDANAEFINQTYEDLLGRPIDAAGQTYWENYLNNNGSRLTMVSSIESSLEFHTLAVENLYEQILGRPADAAGLTYYVSALGTGTTLQQVEAELLNSQEYFNKEGGTTNGFLAGLYQTVLGRTIDSSGQAFFGGVLASGGSRLAVISNILNSVEADTDTVEAIYEGFLGRQADPGGLATFVSAMEHGWSAEQVIAFVVSSNEFYAED